MIRRHVPALTRVLMTSLALTVGAGPWHATPTLAEGPGPGQTRAEYDTRVRESKARAIELLSQGARRRIEAARRWRAEVREARRRGLPTPKPGTRQRPAPINEDLAAGRIATGSAAPAQRLGPTGTTTIPTNVRVNNPAGDPAGTTQAEQAIAAAGNFVLVAWNDGLGPPYQGYGYSRDGGQTFTDGGVPPGLPGWTWVSDPSVTVNEKTGEFYYCGLVDLDSPAPANSNGIGVVRGRFLGVSGPPTWDQQRLVRSVSTASALLDKQWLVADSTTGYLYLTYSTFDATNHIDFQRSTDGGASWPLPAVQISAVSDNGRVQGSRPAIGLGSNLYATWSAIGSTEQDYIRLRRSPNRGASWDPPVTPVSAYLNFGTGAPGFNRERGVDFPSIAVDRGYGANRGRVYLAWTESINKYDDPLSTLGLVETENNDFFSRADPFTPGQRLRGSLSSTTDFDYWSFPAIEGTDYLFECDSVPSPLYTFRVFCGQDTNVAAAGGARLAFSGDLMAPAGGAGYIIWTAPTTGTYYLRMACVTTPGVAGYRISTGIAGVGTERGRDSRDVFTTYADNGTGWTPANIRRVNDANPYYDEWLPEVAVGADGMPYVSWFDWRDDGCGGRSYQYIARSSDGGDTWSANQRFSDVQNDWTSISLNSNLAPDQGDYSHMYADPRYVRVAWADGRGGSPDVFTTRIDTWPLLVCPSAMADSAGHTINPSWTVANLNPLFANSFNYTLTSQRSWPLPAPGTITLAAEDSGPINLSVAVPDTAAPGINRLCFALTNSRGALPITCCFNLTVQSLGGPPPPPPPPPGPAFELGPSVPNPATDGTSITFSLPQAGPVKLRVFGPRGELVRTLLDGNGALGPNTVTWDGLDDNGRLVGAGAYFYKLEAFGQSRTRRLVWLR